jgi:hypothetical protein
MNRCAPRIEIMNRFHLPTDLNPAVLLVEIEYLRLELWPKKKLTHCKEA